jgi:hypothetical protein
MNNNSLTALGYAFPGKKYVPIMAEATDYRDSRQRLVI